jgi:hypothetical protein
MEWNDQMIDDALQEGALSLEKSYPADCSPMSELWMAIDAKRRQRRKIHIRNVWAVAATVLLISTAASIWYVSENARHTPPVVQQKHQPAKLSGPETGTLEYINNLCKGNHIVCSSPDFKELQAELDASLAELTSINQQIKLFGNDELLLQAKTRITDHQTKVIKAMIQML